VASAKTVGRPLGGLALGVLTLGCLMCSRTAGAIRQRSIDAPRIEPRFSLEALAGAEARQRRRAGVAAQGLVRLRVGERTAREAAMALRRARRAAGRIGAASLLQVMPRMKEDKFDLILKPSKQHLYPKDADGTEGTEATTDTDTDGTDDLSSAASSIDDCERHHGREDRVPRTIGGKNDFSSEDAMRFVKLAGGVERLHKLFGSLWPEEETQPEAEHIAQSEPRKAMTGTSPARPAHLKSGTRLPELTSAGPQPGVQESLPPGAVEGRHTKKAKHSAKAASKTERVLHVEPAADDEIAEHKKYVDYYYRYEDVLGKRNNEEMFGMFSAEMCRHTQTRAGFLVWVETTRAARWLRHDLKLRLEAIKSIREFVKNFLAKHPGAFVQGVDAVRVS